MVSVEPMLLALGIALIRPLFAFTMMSLAGARQLPWPVQVMLTVMLALFVMPRIDVSTVGGDPIGLVPILGTEALIGLAIGFCLQLAIVSARIAGELVSNTIGLGFASMVDPQFGQSTPTVSQFMGLIAIAVFMGLDGHVTMIRLIADSYWALPPGGGGPTTQAVWMILRQGNTMFATGFAMALPVVAATLIVQLAMAVTARMAPALNLFAVGVPATLIGGITMLALTVPVVSDAARAAVTRSFVFAAGVTSGAAEERIFATKSSAGAPQLALHAQSMLAQHPVAAARTTMPDVTTGPARKPFVRRVVPPRPIVPTSDELFASAQGATDRVQVRGVDIGSELDLAAPAVSIAPSDLPNLDPITAVAAVKVAKGKAFSLSGDSGDRGLTGMDGTGASGISSGIVGSSAQSPAGSPAPIASPGLGFFG